jgi:hypothetical protein
MYVLKYKHGCPELMLEQFYDEIVSIKNGIALVVNEHNKNSMLSMNYDYIGEIKEENELQEYLKKFDDVVLSTKIETIKVDLDELHSQLEIKRNKPKKEERSLADSL